MSRDRCPATPQMTRDATTVMSIAPLRLATPGRGRDLEFRVTAPVSGDALPVIIFSHGNGQSLYAYGPLANYWAASGFVVVQPTHLDSRMLALPAADERRASLWRHREEDLHLLVNALGQLEATVQDLRGRLDLGRVAAAGHSWGAQSASMLLGATHPDPTSGATVSIADRRVKAGVLLAIPGTGGANLSSFAAQNFPFMNPDFSHMSTPALIVAGDDDHGAMTVRGPDWWREAYDLSPGPKALFSLFGGQHSLGGIPNYEAKETTDESPARLAAVQRLSTAYLKSALYPGDSSFSAAVAAERASAIPQGAIEVKGADDRSLPARAALDEPLMRERGRAGCVPEPTERSVRERMRLHEVHESPKRRG